MVVAQINKGNQLTIFGTFMTRSGVVQSVHAFGEDKQLSWTFTIFMLLIIAFFVGALSLIFWISSGKPTPGR